jgi:hypothetical protein
MYIPEEVISVLQRILSVVQGEISGSSALSDLEQALEDIRDQLNQDPTVDADFATFSPITNVISTTPKNFSSEETYLENVLEELDDAGVILDKDLVVIVDSGVVGEGIGDTFGYGYAGATWSPLGSSDKYTASRVLHTPSQTGAPDGTEIFNNLAIHEAAHALTDQSTNEQGIDADHASGTYDIESGLFFDNARDVSPLATAYTYISGSELIPANVDTFVQGVLHPLMSFVEVFLITRRMNGAEH